ncbi:MAG: iron-containing alcohol dehydrogenase [Clostridia bacterium]|nr:iron-containing alcohol dehydrogenase [Clostridia bacterium]
MPQLLMPGKIIYGKNSLDKIRPERREHTIIISDGGFLETRGFIHSIENRIKRVSARVTTIINGNVHELYRMAAENYFSDEADCIVAIGSGAVIDCGMLLAQESNAEFIAVPVSSACAMTDFENGRYFDYRKSPDCIILDTALMNCVNSGTIAYDGLACFAYAMDAMCESSNAIIQSLAFDSAAGILSNIVSAFRGNMDALEGLMYSMYIAVAAHRNTAGAETSLLTGISNFFGTFGYPKLSVCAVCIPSLIDYSSEMLTDVLCRMSRTLNISRSDDSNSFAAAKMLDEIRKIQASLSVPRSISGFSLSSDDYNSAKINSTLPVDLLDLCYYGSFKFVKL